MLIWMSSKMQQKLWLIFKKINFLKLCKVIFDLRHQWLIFKIKTRVIFHEKITYYFSFWCNFS